MYILINTNGYEVQIVDRTDLFILLETALKLLLPANGKKPDVETEVVG